MHDLESGHRDADGVISFKAAAELIEFADSEAVLEGCSRAAIARKALLRLREARTRSQVGEAA